MDVINSGSFAIPAAINSENDVRSMCKTPAGSKSGSLNSINSSRKKFGQLSNNVQCTPIQQPRRKLGNVSNTPLTNSSVKRDANGGFSKPTSFGTASKNFEATKPSSNCFDLVRKAPSTPQLPVVYEEIENYYPESLSDSRDNSNYACVGMFEIDQKRMMTIPFEEEDEPRIHYIKPSSTATPCLF